MNAPRTRTARIAVATAGLGLAALAVAPAALADGYQQVAPTPSVSSVPPQGPTAVVTTTVQAAPVHPGTVPTTTLHVAGHPASGVRTSRSHHRSHRSHHSHRSSAGALAYTGFEAGGATAAGLGLVVAGAALVRGGRRRSVASA